MLWKNLFFLWKIKNNPIIAVTGNDFAGLSEKRLKTGELPYFDAIIGSVGTEIFILHKNEDGTLEYRRDKCFDSLLARLNFERKSLVEKSMELINWTSVNMIDTHLDFQHPQIEKDFLIDKESEAQPYKISFYFFARQEELDKMSQIFADKFPEQKIIICEEITHNNKLSSESEPKKYCLDIVPFTKRDAVNYLLKVTGINRGVVAGDSGNDLDMLLESENLNGVLVGGYKKEAISGLKKAIEESPDSNWKEGKRSFQRVVNPNGTIKNIYIEPESEKRKASESIARAIEILERAERIFGKSKK